MDDGSHLNPIFMPSVKSYVPERSEIGKTSTSASGEVSKTGKTSYKLDFNADTKKMEITMAAAQFRIMRIFFVILSFVYQLEKINVQRLKALL